MPKLPKKIKVVMGKEARKKYGRNGLLQQGVPKKVIQAYSIAREQIMAGKKVVLGTDKSGRQYIGEMVFNAETRNFVPAIVIVENR